MNKTWNRVITLLLALLMLLFCFVFVSCGDDTPDGPNDPSTDPGTTSGTVPEEPAGEDYLLSIPKQSYGKTFTFLTDVGEDMIHELYFENEEDALGNTVDTAIFYRNNRVAEHLGVTFESMTAPGRFESRESYLSLMQQSYTAGDQDYQLASVYEAFASEGAIKGFYYDINSIEAIDINSPWYVQSWLENTLINDQCYMILGDLSYRMWQNMNALYFNKQMSDELGISEELYTVAEDGELTWDYVMTYAELAASEDGNDIWDQNDTYGMALSLHPLRAMVTYCDIPLTCLNDNDEYEVCLYNERTETIYGELYNYIWENDFVYYGELATEVEMFTTNRVLFLAATLGYSQDLREMSGLYGILPMPKYDTEQEYCSHSNDNFNIFIIPSHAEDGEFCGTLMDALSAESKYSVIPAYYDTVLKGRTTKDEQSIRMLDIIRDNLRFDFAFAHLSTMDYLWTKFGECLRTEGKTSFKSYYDEHATAFDEKLSEIMAKYWEVR